MPRDIRDTAAYREAERLVAAACRPGEGAISDLSDLQRGPGPSRLLFTATLVRTLDAQPEMRIGEIDLETGAVALRTAGPHADRYARLSPDGTTTAFLSVAEPLAGFQLHFLDPRTWQVTAGPRVEGWVEYLAWSPDGQHILLGVADHGAELSSGEGACRTAGRDDGGPSWMPEVIGGSAEAPGRHAWIVDVADGRAWCASGPDNVWEAGWCGNDRLVAVTSPGPGEGDWYGARLSLIDPFTGVATPLYAPSGQIALPRATPSGDAVAFVEAIASDRGYIAGDLRWCDPRDGSCLVLDTGAVDVTSIEWRPDGSLLVAGHRGLETVVLRLDPQGGARETLWADTTTSISGEQATVLALAAPDAFAFIREGFFRPPRVVTVQAGVLRPGPAIVAPASGDAGAGAEPVRWQAPDGLAIEGWLLRPTGQGPHPTVLDIHGGPVLHWRPCWLARTPAALMLLRRDYAVFLPNPRGSSGRGRAFASLVVGDVGGADTQDLLSGVDHLIGAGVADASRLGVMGLSYGGLMTCWLTTQDRRFAAAVAIGPATNHVSHHLLCNIPQFVSLFVGGDWADLAGRYHSRSPILHARKSRTPTMLVCGDLDRCTPAAEAIQFHHALRENGVASCVVRYPEEGHGVDGLRARIDFAARCVTWFDHYLAPDRRPAGNAADA